MMLVFWYCFPWADVFVLHAHAPVNVRNIAKTQIVPQAYHFSYNELQEKLYTMQSTFQLRKSSEKIVSP